MAIKIKRRTGWVGLLGSFNILINDEVVSKIDFDDEIQLEIPAGTVLLQASQSGSKTEQIKVKDGDSIEIWSSPKSCVNFLM